MNFILQPTITSLLTNHFKMTLFLLLFIIFLLFMLLLFCFLLRVPSIGIHFLLPLPTTKQNILRKHKHRHIHTYKYNFFCYKECLTIIIICVPTFSFWRKSAPQSAHMSLMTVVWIHSESSKRGVLKTKIYEKKRKT